MRFNAIIISALAVASLGVKAAPAADGKLDARTEPNDDCDWKCVPRTHPTPPPCVDYCIFYGWDCNTGDRHQLHGLVSQASDVYGCANNGFSKNDCDTTVHNGNFCYGKSSKNALSWNFYKNGGRDLAIKGKCKDLKWSCDNENDPKKKRRK
ncbi:hypothetical protein QFC22_006653 [Naganishia vaughanmartiniae]|uniref:Uncharacterized protein n=1 Tax=Naganishia vaughanmartiniae TaxID=1424756 RepID=A0ACC2WGY4_9TREE|nr:hypothetical protein QFC22_006653 [Naganishia vaughanmartiniae]